jgi:hypothetical protein
MRSPCTCRALATRQVRLALVAGVTMRASRKLHEGALRGVSGSPVGFFDVTPLGRVINRFSSDLQAQP